MQHFSSHPLERTHHLGLSNPGARTTVDPCTLLDRHYWGGRVWCICSGLVADDLNGTPPVFITARGRQV